MDLGSCSMQFTRILKLQVKIVINYKYAITSVNRAEE